MLPARLGADDYGPKRNDRRTLRARAGQCLAGPPSLVRRRGDGGPPGRQVPDGRLGEEPLQRTAAACLHHGHGKSIRRLHRGGSRWSANCPARAILRPRRASARSAALPVHAGSEASLSRSHGRLSQLASAGGVYPVARAFRNTPRIVARRPAIYPRAAALGGAPALARGTGDPGLPRRRCHHGRANCRALRAPALRPRSIYESQWAAPLDSPGAGSAAGLAPI